MPLFTSSLVLEILSQFYPLLFVLRSKARITDQRLNLGRCFRTSVDHYCVIKRQLQRTISNAVLYYLPQIFQSWPTKSVFRKLHCQVQSSLLQETTFQVQAAVTSLAVLMIVLRCQVAAAPYTILTPLQLARPARVQLRSTVERPTRFARCRTEGDVHCCGREKLTAAPPWYPTPEDSVLLSENALAFRESSVWLS